MRRNALCLLATICFSITLTGCSLFHKKASPASAAGPYELYMPPASEALETAGYASYGATALTGSAQAGTPASSWDDSGADGSVGMYDPIETSSQQELSGRLFHTVARKDTLFALARQYYGNQGRWRDIYEANRSVIRDPNKIFVGQRLAIP